MSENAAAVLVELWLTEFVHPSGLCCLCGNSGVIDTRGRVESASGGPCGALCFCICPNGRAWKAGGANLEALVALGLRG